MKNKTLVFLFLIVIIILISLLFVKQDKKENLDEFLECNYLIQHCWFDDFGNLECMWWDSVFKANHLKSEFIYCIQKYGDNN